MITLMQHQREDVDRGLVEPRWLFHNDPGTGKTIMALAIVAEQKARGYAGKTVVVCPKSILWSAWAEDAKHFPALKVVVCYANSMKKRSELIATEGADVLVCNYETFKKHFSDFLTAGCTRLVVDESSKLRNHDSQISRAAYDFSKLVPSVYLLSGTPAPNNATDYFGQMRCVDPSEKTMFGTSYWRFANTYFTPQKKFILGKERVVGWKMLKFAEPNFMARLRSKSSVRRAVDCLDLPEETDVVRKVVLDPEEARVYVSLLQEAQAEFDDGVITQVSANAKSMKLRQVTGGNLYDAGAARVVGRSKLDALLELLEELGPERQVVIWAEFTAEIDRIIEELENLGHSVSRIDGSVTAADVRNNYIQEFQAGRTRYLVCHPAAAGHGITLTAARYDVFYSLGFFPENHEQARKRIHRKGQRHPVVHYYLIAENTVDERVMRVVKGKTTASDEMKAMLAGVAEPTAVAAE